MNSQVIHLAYLKAKVDAAFVFCLYIPLGISLGLLHGCLFPRLEGCGLKWILRYVNGSSLVMGRSAKLVWRYVNGSSLVMERSAMWVWRSSEEVFVGIAFSWHRVQWGLEKLDAYAG
ncbi:hypothetical protein V6N11_023685 [Hibiscus sabdariffa]|uniref:Transmembrane protein n=1 Tax=Hibiscus sabdariffa TaxID=183260 RepID=A0ABR2TNJ2_9ROSI